MSCNEWKEVKLDEIIEFNPKETISKGCIVKKISMDMIKPFYKYIESYVLEEYKGGSKFRNGDTIMARITPCLENGKTAKVKLLDKNEVGFGSTEFVVLRPKKDFTTEDFVYYIAISPYIRDIAIKSMTGTSGRQRVQIDVIKNISISLPPLHEQKAIAKILSDIDEKIEINNRINKVLEEIAQTIFKRWFVDFEFPNENGEPYKSSGGEMVESELGPIPKGWEVKRLGDLITRNKEKFKHKKQWYMLDIIDLSVMPRFSISISEFSRGYNFDTNIYKLNEYDILFGSIRPYFGKAGFSPINGGVAGTVYSFQPIDKSNYSFILFLISSRGFIDYSISMSRGTKMPVVSFEDIGNYLVPYNEKTIKKFNDMTIDFIKIIKTNIIKNKLLASIRDTLLPKLMSGEIRVPLDESK